VTAVFNPAYTVRGIRETESRSIRQVLEHFQDDLRGDVLDFGCGTQPYRSLVEGYGGTYEGYDRHTFPGAVEGVGDVGDRPFEEMAGRYDTVVCTQVIQYCVQPLVLLMAMAMTLRPGGVLLMTGPGNWPEVEPSDACRFTRAGIARLLNYSGHYEEDPVVYNRHGIAINDVRLSLGWAARAVRV
jgi:SAM-dependent methyltransferase